MRNNQLFNGALIFFLFITGALIFSNINHRIKSYKRSNYDVFLAMQKNKTELNYADFVNIISLDTKEYLIIDLRNNNLYDTLHLEGAINIPFEILLDKENISFFKKNKELKILYADTENKSALACMMLLSSGIENIKYLPGHFNIIYKKLIKENNPSFYFYNDDKAKWDYKRQMGGVKPQDEQTPAIPQQIEIKPAVKGGC